MAAASSTSSAFSEGLFLAVLVVFTAGLLFFLDELLAAFSLTGSMTITPLALAALLIGGLGAVVLAPYAVLLHIIG